MSSSLTLAWRPFSVVLAAALLLGLAAPALPTAPAPAARPAAGLDPGLPLIGDPLERVVVTGTAVARAVADAGGRVREALPIVSGVAADVPADRLRELAADPRVATVTADRAASFEEYSYDESTVASNFARSSQATAAWAAGNYGKGVGVAVLDTGVSPMPDFAGRLVQGPDLSGEGTVVDSYGHGTVMAGAIAGSGADSIGRVGGAFTGVAPGAHVVAVKTAGRNGVVDVSTMLQAMHWVLAYKDQFNIRVLNLSWGVPSTQGVTLDPINYAVERLWDAGIVVVVSAGNSGPSAGTILKPGDDPVAITVGAFDDKGDGDPSNDNIPGWSSRGPTAQGRAKPDLVTPGRTIVTARSFGSHVEQTYPKAWVSPSYIKGSGTSQAAAVASGLVALLLAARPELTPDNVKELLMKTASPLAGVDRYQQGAGRVQLAAALAATPTAAPQVRPATGLGSLEASRGAMHVQAYCNDVLTEIRGEIDVRCEAWNPNAWTGAPWNGDAWTGVTWKGAEWTGVSWKSVAWSDATWTGVTWKGGTWTSDSWQGTTGWNGGTSVTSAWTGVTWKEATWTGVSWKSADWTSADYTSAEYGVEETTETGFLTVFWGPQPPPGRRIPGEVFTPRVVPTVGGPTV